MGQQSEPVPNAGQTFARIFYSLIWRNNIAYLDVTLELKLLRILVKMESFQGKYCLILLECLWLVLMRRLQFVGAEE